ncbi:major facilitator superfamily domain-containing protein [Gilbertella persicaria]|uniref:major facilitator superfamily domain-containing protein n=1 Tax=Gilbertella persicaria TaxID=101096 RepID=UPI00222043B3|nr:major facilitator superfamily domain-containing protein [Gilbertella persicaria]KAI8083301.1 major facilitator superfamily domain-containing protein [Gilbertella persicaria]
MKKLSLLGQQSSSTSLKSYQAIPKNSFTEEEKSFVLVTTLEEEDLEWTEQEEKQVLNILDKHLMIFILLMTFVLNMDRTNISNAISDNLAQDLGFTNDGVNTGISVYHFVFTLFTLPSNTISKMVGPHLWIPILMSSWAVVTWAHALIHDFNGFIIVRIMIAITEAGFIPACLSYLSQWYKTQELATRLALFWASQALASSVSGLISFGVFRMRGIYGLEGWKWLFIIDGIATHIVGIIAFFYLPSSASHTKGGLRGREGWLTKRQIRIAIQRIIKDDATKKEHHKPITRKDAYDAFIDFNLWVHLSITFLGMMSNTPIQSYLPSIIKDAGFSTTTANLLTAPSHIIGLVFSVIIAHMSDKHGNVSLYALIGSSWALIGFTLLEFLPDTTGRWELYFAALFTASSPSWHGMQIAWMSANLAPIGKRTLALAAVIGAANINGVPGSQIYQTSDAPRFRRGNKINIFLNITTILLFMFQRGRYKLTNKWRNIMWNNMTASEQKEYIEENKSIGNYGLDFQYRL